MKEDLKEIIKERGLKNLTINDFGWPVCIEHALGSMFAKIDNKSISCGCGCVYDFDQDEWEF